MLRPERGDVKLRCLAAKINGCSDNRPGGWGGDPNKEVINTSLELPFLPGSHLSMQFHVLIWKMEGTLP